MRARFAVFVAVEAVGADGVGKGAAVQGMESVAPVAAVAVSEPAGDEKELREKAVDEP